MNSRERTLLGILFGILIVAGYVAAVYYFFLEDYLSARGQLSKDRAELDEKTKAKTDAENDQKRMFERDPRLKDWRIYSAPDLEPVKGGGKHTDEEIQRHLTKNQNEYLNLLQGLLQTHRFSGVNIVPKKPDTKTLDAKAGPTSKDKTPILTRFPYTVEASGTYANIIDLLRDFYSKPLLHEVRTLTITKPATPREGGTPGQPALDLTMTVELLMVTGAEPRSKLLPNISKSDMAQVLAKDRDYNAMLDKDLFNGRPVGRPLTPPTDQLPEKEAEVTLQHVKLTMIVWNPDRDRWNATFYDQGAGPPEKLVNLVIVPKLTIKSANKIAFEATLVYIDAKQLVLEDKSGNYYRMHVGDFIQDARERPLKDGDLKEFNLKKKVAAATTQE
jgi:hypothetical protein